MPYVTIVTNLPKEEIPSDFTGNVAENVARILNKSIQATTVILHAGLSMSRFGNSDRTASVVLRDIQPFDDKERNRRISKDMISFVAESLKIESNRISLIFESENPIHIGLAGGVLLYDRHAAKGKISPQ